jgi:hypothetical protein
LSFFNLNHRTPRPPQGPPLGGYPAFFRRVLFWYDNLNDWQRVQYCCVAILFLLACGGYLLGLGSAIVLARVDSEEALAAEALPTEEPSPTAVPVIATEVPTPTPLPTATRVPPTPVPTQTPFSAPVIAEPPAAPRQLPAEAPVVVAPVAPRPAPTTAKPRNLETAQPEAPSARVATPTPGLVRPVRTAVATAERAAALTPTPRGEVRATPLPALVVPPTAVPTKAVVVAPVATAAPTRAQAPAQPTAVKTPPAR